jgi:hypothetical protein
LSSLTQLLSLLTRLNLSGGVNQQPMEPSSPTDLSFANYFNDQLLPRSTLSVCNAGWFAVLRALYLMYVDVGEGFDAISFSK